MFLYMKLFHNVLKLLGRSLLITREIGSEPGLELEPEMRDLKDRKPERLDYTGVGPDPGSVSVRAGSCGSIAHPIFRSYYFKCSIIYSMQLQR